jgi:hypothetical protein
VIVVTVVLLLRLIALRELAKICKLEREISQLSSDSR